MARGRGIRDLTGLTFGSLVVTVQDGWYIAPKTGKRMPLWRCHCTCGCGRERVSSGGTIQRRGRGPEAQRCGLRYPGEQIPGQAGKTAAWHGMIGGARTRGISVFLSREAFEAIITCPCFYCGRPPHLKRRRSATSDRAEQGRELGACMTNTCDRIDSAVGYQDDNAVAACHICNVGKSDYSPAEWVEYLAGHSYYFWQHAEAICARLKVPVPPRPQWATQGA